MTKENKVKLTDQAKRLNIVFKEFDGAIRPFASVLGISPTSAHRMLNGKQPITFEVLKAVCYKMGYNADWMLSGTGQKKQKAGDRGKIITDIAMFQTELQIVNARVDVLNARLKYYDEQLLERKKQG